MAIVKLITVPNSQKAALIQNCLENEGIRNFTTNENFSTLMPHYFGILGSGIQIMVNQADLVKARKVLIDNFPDSDSATKIVCPECGSDQIFTRMGKNWMSKWFIIFMSLLFVNPFANIQSSRYCDSCKYEF